MPEFPMTGKVITVTVTAHNDDLLFSHEAIALLLGVPVDQIRQLGHVVTNTADVPVELARSGKRRIREAYAAIGDDNDLCSAIEYWAAKDHGATVEFVFGEGVTCCEKHPGK